MKTIEIKTQRDEINFKELAREMKERETGDYELIVDGEKFGIITQELFPARKECYEYNLITKLDGRLTLIDFDEREGNWNQEIVERAELYIQDKILKNYAPLLERMGV